MKSPLGMVVCLTALCSIATVSALADQSGLAGMHAHRMEKGRRCFTDHTHVGTGTRQPSKRLAIASAAESWTSFTAFEYGGDWASWHIATGKQVMCENGAGQWSCEVHARPCLLGRGGSLQARR